MLYPTKDFQFVGQSCYPAIRHNLNSVSTVISLPPGFFLFWGGKLFIMAFSSHCTVEEACRTFWTGKYSSNENIYNQCWAFQMKFCFKELLQEKKLSLQDLEGRNILLWLRSLLFMCNFMQGRCDQQTFKYSMIHYGKTDIIFYLFFQHLHIT